MGLPSLPGRKKNFWDIKVSKFWCSSIWRILISRNREVLSKSRNGKYWSLWNINRHYKIIRLTFFDIRKSVRVGAKSDHREQWNLKV